MEMAPLGMDDAALLRLLRELPSCAPALIIATLSDMVSNARGGLVGGSVGSDTEKKGGDKASMPMRASQLTALRFLLTYVCNATPLPSLAASWPRLLSLLRGALANISSAGGCTPPLLLLIQWEWNCKIGLVWVGRNFICSSGNYVANDVHCTTNYTCSMQLLPHLY